MELQDRFDELRTQGIGVAAISYDSQEQLAKFADRRGITDAPLLSDHESSVIRAFGIYNHVAEEALGKAEGDPEIEPDVARYVSARGPQEKVIGTPFPGTFVVDCNGRVTARFFEPFYRERNTAANIMLRLAAPLPGVAKSSCETPHLAITAAQSNHDVTAGSRFHLTLDIAPKANIHVYAPGAEELGYRVIGLELETPDHLRVVPVDYPPSVLYHFKALHESAPVYLQPFRLTQELVVEASEQALEKLSGLEALTLRGRLNYQACDAQLCFDPVSVPLTWTVSLSPLDRQPAR